ncbi:EamA family transporter [Rhizobium sp. ARZ01]|uniref:EamA family transporter n=1 Tax=Rhizobium sp. ARZ01 TaxID=2769313 RepID=UPI0017845569|nr:EamA family transporter [Rhizobium sp. ARZ01]MBD9374357.1 EamA family transporter [Rhizobium sp. ARZ01]
MDQRVATNSPGEIGNAVRGLPSDRTALLSGVLFCLLSMSSVQIGSALSADLIAAYGPFATSFLRLLFAALILMAVLRPPIRSYSRAQWKSAILLGITMAAMTVCFYGAIARIPLGLTVAIEFLGPLAVASFGLVGWRLVWPVAALAGVVLLCHNGESWTIDTAGLLLAAGAGVGWGCYIVLMKRSGKLFPGLEGLAISLLVAAIACAPVGLLQIPNMMSPAVLSTMLGLAILVPLLPYALEMIALRRMPIAAFGILMSLEPAIGALAGFLILHQPMTPLQMLGTALVVAASAGVTIGAKPTAT